ncbi:hydrogenase maturation protease [Candidatus Bathyarchaeota archaeon]|nr:hydrogenase maturation protease [Candidatus Bathyarchaeota archaeon]
MKSKRIVVLGFGNPLASDDGLGPEVLKEIRRIKLPKNVKVYDADPLRTNLPSILKGVEKVIVIDALKTGDQRPSLLRLRLNEMKNSSKLPMPLSVHSLSSMDLLLLCRKIMGEEFPKEVIIIGAEVESLEGFHACLSETVRRAIPSLVRMVLDELSMGNASD